MKTVRKQKLLLLQDVLDLGRSGDVVAVRSGYARNFLIPKKLALFASRETVKLQEKLQEERLMLAAKDKKESEELALKLAEVALETKVKLDPEGNLYGSVTAFEIAKMLQDKGYQFEKRDIALPHPIKTLGKHKVPLKLKEGVMAEVSLEIFSE